MREFHNFISVSDFNARKRITSKGSERLKVGINIASQ